MGGVIGVDWTSTDTMFEVKSNRDWKIKRKLGMFKLNACIIHIIVAALFNVFFLFF